MTLPVPPKTLDDVIDLMQPVSVPIAAVLRDADAENALRAIASTAPDAREGEPPREENGDAHQGLAKAIVDALPRCAGEWIGGSGAHRTMAPCPRIATLEDPDDFYRYACDAHRASIAMTHTDDSNIAELPYADEVRAAERARFPG